MNSIRSARHSQHGVVSITMTIIMIAILGLIVLAISQIARREQSSSLNAQLGTQAYYAAESGVNDAIVQINKDLKNNVPITTDNDCHGANDGVQLGDPANNVAYTCVMVDPTPDNLKATLGSASSVLELKPATGSLGTIELTWHPNSTAPGANLAMCPTGTNNVFSPKSIWKCPNGVLRYDITDVDSGSRADLINNTGTGFLVPSRGGVTSTPINWRTHGATQSVACNSADFSCTAQISGLGSGTYFIRLNTIYVENVGLTITQTSGGKFADAQVQIDATGKAQDVLRRIRVAIDLTHPESTADAAVVAGSIDKKPCTWQASDGPIASDDGNYLDNCTY